MTTMLTEMTSTTSSQEDEAAESAESQCQKHVCSQYLKKEQPDLYGQKHAIETRELIQDSLILLEDEMWKLPEELQGILVRVSIECPEIFESKQHRLMFLRCEQFNVDMAATRLSRYWQRRIELFGDAAFQPMTLANCREIDEEIEFKMGLLYLLPKLDDTGRSVVYMDPSVVEGQDYNGESIVKAAWYTLHAALENETAQQKGIVFLVNLATTLPRHFDRKLTQLLANSIRGVLPVRVSVIHIFHAPYLLEVLFDVVSILLGERITKRIKIYSGEDTDRQMEEFGVHSNALPIDLGGEVVVDQSAWLANREHYQN